MAYKNKYLKYKLKYLNLKKNLRGGMNLRDEEIKKAEAAKAARQVREREEKVKAPSPSGPPPLPPGSEYVSSEVGHEEGLDSFETAYVPNQELIEMHKAAHIKEPDREFMSAFMDATEGQDKVREAAGQAEVREAAGQAEVREEAGQAEVREAAGQAEVKTKIGRISKPTFKMKKKK